MKWIIYIGFFLASTHLFGQLSLDSPAFIASATKLEWKMAPYPKYPIIPFYTTMASLNDQNRILLSDPDKKAFFCRIEDAIVKSAKINFKFRLGSVNYVDRLEGKGYYEAIPDNRKPLHKRK